MAPQHHTFPMLPAQRIHRPRQIPPRRIGVRPVPQEQLPLPVPRIQIAQFQRHQPERYPPLPRLPQHRPQPAVEIRFQIRRFCQALAALIL